MTHAILIAHGQPSDPASAQAELAALAALVAAILPGWTVGAATLAQDGALALALAGESAAKGGQRGGVVFPLFMAGGWFTRTHLPARLAQAGADPARWQVLEPFGCDPALHMLAARVVAEAAAAAGWALPDTGLILAAHGSGRSPAPSDVARHVLDGIATALPLARAEVAFIDQTPQLIHATGFGAQSLCLPYFAAAGGHVSTDIPQALAAAGFAGRLLPHLGADARIPALIAAALRAARPICTADCRWRRP